MKWISGVLIAALLSNAVEAAPTVALGEENFLRLPKTSIPTRYDLKLAFSVIGSSAIAGNVKIVIDIIENTDTITLHNRGLHVSSVKLATNLLEEIDQTFSFEPEKDFMHVVASRVLLAGEKVTLEIIYTGQLQTNMLGIYRSSYKANATTR